jgi:hypothetical protein
MPLAVSSASLSRLHDLRAEGPSGGDVVDGYAPDDLEGALERRALLSDGKNSMHAAASAAPAVSMPGVVVARNYMQVARLKLELYVAEVRLFLGSSSCNFLLLNALSTGVVNQIFETYLFISLEESIHASKGFGGLCTCIGSFSCAPVFYFSGRWIEAYGHGRCIFAAEAIYAVRLVLLVATPYNWAYSKEVLLVQHLLHGPSFALFWAASVDAIFKQSPKHLGASCMGVLNMFFNTLGACIGSLLWGCVLSLSLVVFVCFYFALSLSISLSLSSLVSLSIIYFTSTHTLTISLSRSFTPSRSQVRVRVVWRHVCELLRGGHPVAGRYRVLLLATHALAGPGPGSGRQAGQGQGR